MPSKINRVSFKQYVMPAACIVLALSGCSAPRIHPIYDQIDTEKKSLPDKVSAESLSLSGGFLRTEMIVELLSDRNLTMLEVTPVRSASDPQLARLAWDEREWSMPVALFKFVQLRLAAKGDATCIPDEKLPPRLRAVLVHPPIVAGTCLSMSISPVSSARHAIRLRKREGEMAYDRWELVDTASNRVEAFMSTSAPELRDGPNRDLWQFDNRYPHTNLLRLVDRSDAAQAPLGRFYMKRVVTASADPDPQLSGKSGPDMPVSTRWVAYPKPKSGFLDSEDWPKAVAEARTTGWGYYQRDLLERASGVRWNLNLAQVKMVNTGFDRLSYKVEAGDRGFYVSPASFDPEKRYWLSHYDAKGQLLWQVFVPRVTYQSGRRSCSGDFTLARATPEEIVFQRNCYASDDVEGMQQVEERVFKKKDIAAQLGRPNLN
ncbi:hypothetical protein IV454_02565 [Massilia antarctica]|uniref:Lipoprotein n=1 Tax=Massilia antarctica TaxID=2765360 RepID=A0AA49A8H2_9BURK|nr:hypothetical protein [Massilia antarctica]QPI50523.1 hypothetical protein IV454_02565 [Massilia antarctica]